jgi:CBS domain-containing protein
MKCSDVMKTDIETLDARSTVLDAAKRMRTRGVGFLPVCDDGRRPMGTLTDRDIVLRVVAEGRPVETAVADVMTLEVVSCRPEDDISIVASKMAENHKSRIMVVGDDNALVGVISLSDLAQHDESAADTLRDVSDREARA